MNADHHCVDNNKAGRPILVELFILLIVGVIALIVYPIKYVIKKIRNNSVMNQK